MVDDVLAVCHYGCRGSDYFAGQVFDSLSVPYVEKYETGLPRVGKSIMVRKKLPNRTREGDMLLWAPRKVYDLLQSRTNVESLTRVYKQAEARGCSTVFDLHSGYIPKIMLDQISPDSSIFFYTINCSENGLNYDLGELGGGRKFSIPGLFPRLMKPTKKDPDLEFNKSRVNRKIPTLVHETGIRYVQLEMMIPQHDLQAEKQKASVFVKNFLEMIKNGDELPLNGTV
jgi:hypothetical protein